MSAPRARRRPTALVRRARGGGRGTRSARVLVLHGPNLNLLGTREPDVYGTASLDEINAALELRATALGLTLAIHQSNHEGVLLDLLHEARTSCRAVVLNPGALTHTSIALRDAVVACGLPTIEVHLSNTLAREPFRHVSYVGGVCAGRIEGLGAEGYHLALMALAQRLGAAPRHE